MVAVLLGRSRFHWDMELFKSAPFGHGSVWIAALSRFCWASYWIRLAF
jgi:hypothetical protein